MQQLYKYLASRVQGVHCDNAKLQGNETPIVHESSTQMKKTRILKPNVNLTDEQKLGAKASNISSVSFYFIFEDD